VAVIGHVEWLELGVGRERLVPGAIVNIEAEYSEPGGGGGVSVRALPALGASHTRFYTALGDDENARRSEQILTADGVEVCAARRDRPQNRAYTVVDPTGERTIFVRGTNDHPTLEDDLPWDDLGSFDGVFYTGEDPGSLHAARKAKVLVVTARRFDSLVESGVEVDVLIGSSSDVNEQIDLSRLRARPRIVARTAGARGGTYTLADGTTGSWSAAPPAGPIVDTYGAGDVFMAALTLGLGRGDRLDDALAFGARASAAQLTRRAGSPR
jgi:ribokinase